MTRLSVELVLSFAVTFTLVLIDKAGKYGGGVQVILLLLLAILLGDVALRLPWVSATTDTSGKSRRKAIVLCVILSALVLLGWWTWPSKVSVNFRAHIPQAESAYPQGTVIGNVNWNPAWTDVRVDVENGPIPIQNLDLTVETDALIAGVGQVSQLPEFAAFPIPQMLDEKGNGIKIGQGGLIVGKDDKGNTVTQPVDFGRNGDICQTYRVHCANIFSNATLQLVVGSFRFHPAGPHGEPAKELRQPPKFIRLKGSYETAGPEGAHRYPVDQTIRFGQ